MSQQNVDAVRRGYEAFDRGGLEAIADLIHPKFESTGGDMERLSGIVARGPEGAQRWLESVQEAWDYFRFEPEELIDADDHRVVAVVHISGRGKQSGVELEGHSTHVWTERDGKFVRLEVYSTKEEALEALRLQK